MRALVLLGAVLLVAGPAGAASPISAKLTTSTATPVVGQAWRYTLTVKSASGRPLAARARLQLLVGPTVVGCWKDGEMVQCFGQAAGDWVSFRGKRSGVLRFPGQSVGVKLTFQATVRALRQTRKLRAPVTVRPAP